MIVRTLSVGFCGHTAVLLLKKVISRRRERAHWPFFFKKPSYRYSCSPLVMIPAESKLLLKAMPKWLADGMQIGGGMVGSRWYAMIYQHDG